MPTTAISQVNNIDDVAGAGADTFVAGSVIFGSPDYYDTISLMRANATA